MTEHYDHNQAGVVPRERRAVVTKGWGWEDWIWNSDRYCGKVLYVHKDKLCSYHYHRLKDETFLVAEGKVLVRYQGPSFPVPATWGEAALEWVHAQATVLYPGDVFRVPVFMRHQFCALEESKIIEFSSRHHDDDTFRLVPGN